ncbi:MAG: tetratricopeptide repeat protein [Eubacteriales bacterium]
MFIKSVKRKKVQRYVFIFITVLISIGLVVPLVSLFGNGSGTPAKGGGDQAQQQSFADRLAELEAKAKENPSDTAVLMQLAEAYTRAGKQDQSVLTYQSIIAQDPDNLDSRLNLGTLYFYSGKYDQSITSLQEVIKRDPNNQLAHYWCGYVLGVGKKDYAGGVQELEKYVELAKTGIDVEKARQDIVEWKKLAGK